MAQSQQTRCRGSGTAEDLLSDRLYAGSTGHGKTVTIGQDIQELLESDIDCRVIEISAFQSEVGRDDLEEDGWISRPGDVVSKRTLRARVEDYEYTHLFLDDHHPEQRTETAQVHLDVAASVAEEIDKPAVVAVDADPPLRAEEFVEQADRDTNIWLISQLATTRTYEAWLGTFPNGTVVLHSVPTRHQGKEAVEYLDATPANVKYVQKGPVRHERGNQILVGRPGDWEHQYVQCVGADMGSLLQ